jgi:hypothetical protein
MPKKSISKTEMSTLSEDFKNIQEIKIPHFPYKPIMGIEFLAYFSII